jgi:hypothetical protein
MSLYTGDRRFKHACAIIAKTWNLQELKLINLSPEMLPYLYNCPSLKVVKYNRLYYFFTQLQKNEIEHHERITFVQIRFDQI